MEPAAGDGQERGGHFLEHGISLVKTSNNRISGWMAVKEWLRPYVDEQGVEIADLRIFPHCKNLIRTLPAVQYDDKDPNDVAQEPTSSPCAGRHSGVCVYWTRGTQPGEQAGSQYYG